MTLSKLWLDIISLNIFCPTCNLGIPPKDIWRKNCQSSCNQLPLRLMISGNVLRLCFSLFNTKNVGKPPSNIQPSNIHDVELRLLSNFGVSEIYCVCGQCIFQHISTVCLGTVALRDA